MPFFFMFPFKNICLKIIKVIILYLFICEDNIILNIINCLHIVKQTNVKKFNNFERNIFPKYLRKNVDTIFYPHKSSINKCYITNRLFTNKKNKNIINSLKKYPKLKSNWYNGLLNIKRLNTHIYMIDNNEEHQTSEIIDNILNNKGYNENNEGHSFLEIFNDQIDVPIDLAHFEKETKKLINILNFNNVQLIIKFVDLKEMKNINKKYRNKNEPTDIISILNVVKNDDTNNEILHSDDFFYINNSKSGDIFLCPEYINRECVISKMKYEKKILKSNSEEVIDEYISTNSNEEENKRGVNKLFRNIFDVNERLPFYVLHGLIHLMHKDHVNSFKEYTEFMDLEEQTIGKYFKFHKFTNTFYAHHIIGIGTDILCVNRIYKILEKNKNFIKKVLNSFELAEFETKKEKLNEKISTDLEKLAVYVSKKFAAKEAILKSMGRGLSSISKYGLSMNDIEIKNDKYGKPHVNLYGKAKKVAYEMGIVKIFLSISDEKIINNQTNNTSCNFPISIIQAQALSVGSNV
ncbi:holo-[acyl-carrier-protein] synthase, putative [Plasmodium berghei]|uniref:Holo-[acyl-carrier-protein] synthase, putative n=2 Tax=Plasmodium berghei TaxID=5821 RepID=A0A509ALK7_PLABA|nr:holo-[acyl-carrier-protein] synthase, putative [Plasmodium berghei ANKA]CXI12743.1 holo-[acyl-carrier-protein] synthase, putative [Plasmodium berghei]SCL93397.1 holo-[acyl-carrier-protein] synthase, putative [Plasmodium berghei]SCM15853.1 holo-[acyl-carrier-protein] synthase, putative [Plasmodium berghei]SCM17649.1 holo-[acyl-carrier-protein] synthase, putative [Plasmodium berghei]SCN23177.1 holo-[acyl-carrier-protein] synthase, putative [Plasmodium berghei]|eukprot:XP_034420457.1 holo-[acyl-carrier-protein] synthase, putative [Plasmodium berghei ANKA]